MTIRWFVASLHLIALGIGMGAIAVRARGLRNRRDPIRLRAILLADTFWGIAAVIWIGTGLWRAFGGLERGTAYYLGNHVFWLKMTLLSVILVLEIWPMTVLIRWRMALARNQDPDTSIAPVLGTISVVQLMLVIAMVFVATAMARGVSG